jgi:hypothetical protein
MAAAPTPTEVGRLVEAVETELTTPSQTARNYMQHLSQRVNDYRRLEAEGHTTPDPYTRGTTLHIGSVIRETLLELGAVDTASGLADPNQSDLLSEANLVNGTLGQLYTRRR